MEHTKIIFTCE